MATKQHSRYRRCSKMILCLLCLFVALSFVAPLLPIASAISGSSTMPCCAGKAGHCDSGIASKHVSPPPSEPMCGLKGATIQDDGVTIVAEPIQSEPTHSPSHHGETSSSVAKTYSNGAVAESASLGKPCRMDCGACLGSSARTQKRERSVFQAIAFHSSSLTTSDRFEYLSLPFSSNEAGEQTSPRGPPAHLL